MSSYDNDPRVRKVNAGLYSVTAPGGPFDVSIWADPDEWSVGPAINSELCRNAGLRNREDADRWAEETTTGPFRTADEAIASLIGPPRR